MSWFGGGERAVAQWFQDKQSRMEAALGPMQEGCVQMIVGPGPNGPNATYFFHQHLEGSGLATMELAPLKGKHARNSVYKKYELVGFVPMKVGQDLNDLSDVAGATPGGQLRAAIAEVGAYAFEAQLQPGNTLEFPEGFGPAMSGRAFVFDAYLSQYFNSAFGLMLLMEVHRQEMAWALENNGEELIAKLKAAGAYPFSNLQRPTVV